MEQFDYDQNPVINYFIDKLQTASIKNNKKRSTRFMALPIKPSPKRNSDISDIKKYKAHRSKNYQFKVNLEKKVDEKQKLEKSQIEIFEGVKEQNTNLIENSMSKQKRILQDRLRKRRAKSLIGKTRYD